MRYRLVLPGIALCCLLAAAPSSLRLVSARVSQPLALVEGTLTGVAYGSFPTAVALPGGQPYVDRFVLYVRSKVGLEESAVNCRFARWRINGHPVRGARAFNALQRLDNGHHLIQVSILGAPQNKEFVAREVTVTVGRRRHHREPIYNSAP